jgi:adenylate cyclase
VSRSPNRPSTAEAPDLQHLQHRVRFLLTGSIVLSNLIGAVAVAVIIIVVVPRSTPLSDAEIVANVIAVPVYVLVAIVVGVLLGSRSVLAGLGWVAEDRDPDEAEQRAALRAPLRLLAVQGTLWGIAVVVFTVLNGILDPESIPRVCFSVFAAGVITCANTYLSSEYILRPVAARALAAHPPERLLVPGMTARALTAWAVGSGIPIVGLMAIAVFALAQGDTSAGQLSVAILVLGGTTLAVGLLLSVQAVRAAVDPIRDIRGALGRVERGELDIRVGVYDGSEVGLLQAGFNRMVEGLAERERIRDLFGRHVGEDVASAALAARTSSRVVELGGEERDVAVVFVDIIGSTALASDRPPAEVVALLNRFFAVVVEVVTDHGGFVNKFEGDGALAVFGAPTDLVDPAAAALGCARELAARLVAEVPECPAGIGASAGHAVAGNIGAEQRFEYTVIGDPVNEAARLTELAKTLPGHVAASAAAVARAGPGEARRWSHGDAVELRGRATPTTIATPTDVPVVVEGDHCPHRGDGHRPNGE